jgi:hypothetical protein
VINYQVLNSFTPFLHDIGFSMLERNIGFLQESNQSYRMQSAAHPPNRKEISLPFAFKFACREMSKVEIIFE